MKIYTEINYEFKNGELTELDSKSFNYTGEVAMCLGGGGSAQKIVSDNTPDIPDPTEDATEVLTEMADVVTDNVEPEPEPEPDPEYASSTGIGSLQGQNALLAINKKTQGPTGAFTRGSLRVRKPKPVVVS